MKKALSSQKFKWRSHFEAIIVQLIKWRTHAHPHTTSKAFDYFMRNKIKVRKEKKCLHLLKHQTHPAYNKARMLCGLQFSSEAQPKVHIKSSRKKAMSFKFRFWIAQWKQKAGWGANKHWNYATRVEDPKENISNLVDCRASHKAISIIRIKFESFSVNLKIASLIEIKFTFLPLNCEAFVFYTRNFLRQTLTQCEQKTLPLAPTCQVID